MHGIPIGRIAGFPVRVDWGVLVILWLFTWSLASTLPTTAPGLSTRTYWLAGACGAVVLLASLLAHELAHAIVARRAGVEVLDVTLWLFGGVTRLGGQATTPRTALRIAIAGPATSLSLAALFTAAGTEFRILGAGPIVVAVAFWLAGINGLRAFPTCCRVRDWTVDRFCARGSRQRHGDPARAALSAGRGPGRRPRLYPYRIRSCPNS